jgi:hypothetical protein
MYPLNPDVMWQDMRYRRDRLLGVRRGHPWLASARERLTRRAAGEVPADPATTTVEVASTPSPEVVVPTQRQAGELGQGLRSRRRPSASEATAQESDARLPAGQDGTAER